MKLRLLPVFITIVVSSSVLFGGWFMYQAYAMENPFVEQALTIEGVHQVSVDIKRTEAAIQVELGQEANLRQVYQSIVDLAKETLDGRMLTVTVEGNSSEELDQLWSRTLFHIAQAMETRQYSLIPQHLERLSEEDHSITYQTEMDETNVYISITKGQHSKHVILPRVAAQMGVWPGE